MTPFTAGQDSSQPIAEIARSLPKSSAPFPSSARRYEISSFNGVSFQPASLLNEHRMTPPMCLHPTDSLSATTARSFTPSRTVPSSTLSTASSGSTSSISTSISSDPNNHGNRTGKQSMRGSSIIASEGCIARRSRRRSRRTLSRRSSPRVRSLEPELARGVPLRHLQRHISVSSSPSLSTSDSNSAPSNESPSAMEAEGDRFYLRGSGNELPGHDPSPERQQTTFDVSPHRIKAQASKVQVSSASGVFNRPPCSVPATFAAPIRAPKETPPKPKFNDSKSTLLATYGGMPSSHNTISEAIASAVGLADRLRYYLAHGQDTKARLLITELLSRPESRGQVEELVASFGTNLHGLLCSQVSIV
ncbi:unnamed protein product [Protopolystoma xenopodis]|uniref:Uncharacterized protein n=1 Tax=Protopolystoma xenopodis TaxID=117903 RepID=A0A448WF28_9PLAT|nr:unnamed protein product [Protopolystoma xenopodis]